MLKYEDISASNNLFLKSDHTGGAACVFSTKTVKPITDFDAKHLKGGGFKRTHLPADMRV